MSKECETNIENRSEKVDAQSLLFDAKFWHLRKLNDISLYRRMQKSPNTFGEKKINDNENAKKIANMWADGNPMVADIEEFLRQYPIDNIWYLVSIFVHLEKKGIERGELIENKKEANRKFNQRKRGGLKLSEINPKSKIIREIKKQWETWQNQGAEGTSVAFAKRMADVYGDNVTVKNITDNCTRWKKERVS